MIAAVSTAFASRQVITHRIREVFSAAFGRAARSLGLEVVHDVGRNTAKLERHVVDRRELELVVHRKGATRAFGPGAPDVPEDYRPHHAAVQGLRERGARAPSWGTPPPQAARASLANRPFLFEAKATVRWHPACSLRVRLPSGRRSR